MLSPLGKQACHRLLAGLLEQSPAAPIRARLLARIGGNPLYAEEYVRLLLDRGLLRKTDEGLRLDDGTELPLPGTVQAVLQARLDTLPAGYKALLCDAAVFGESFWEGGVHALASGSAQLKDALAALVSRQLVRKAGSSSLAGEGEYLFWHALARDVAYDELPKRVRMEKHAAAAAWLEATAGERVQDFAEKLVHHVLTGMDIAQEVGQADRYEQMRDPAVRYLLWAGDHAMRLDVAAAEDHYARAAELAQDNGRRRQPP